MNIPSRRPSAQHPRLGPLERVFSRCPPESTSPYLFLMSGLPGSGKTTVAHQLADRHQALILSLDEFLVSLHGPSHIIDAPAERSHRVNALREPLWAIARRALNLGLSVILDDGFFTRESRARALSLCAPTMGGVISIQPVIVYCRASLPVLEERLAERSRQQSPFCHHISPELLAAFSARFEPPTHEEGMTVIEVCPAANGNE